MIHRSGNPFSIANSGRYEVALLVSVGFAMFGAALSKLRLSPTGACGAEAVRVREGQRAAGE